MTARAGNATLADHMAVVRARQGRKAAPAPTLPLTVRHVWNAFIDLSRSRPAGGFAPSGIPYSEIEAYSRLNGVHLLPWEVRGIRALDDAYLEQAASELQAERDRPNV